MNSNTTPSSNVVFIQKLYGFFAQGNIPAILAQLSPQIEWHGMGSPLLPYGGDYTGQSVGQFFQGMSATLNVSEFAVSDFIERGEDVLAFGMIGGTARNSGVAFRSSWIMHWKFHNGQPCYFQDYVDTAKLYAAIVPSAEMVGL